MNKPKKPSKNDPKPSTTIQVEKVLFYDKNRNICALNEDDVPKLFYANDNRFLNEDQLEQLELDRLSEWELTFSVLQKAAQTLKLNDFQILQSFDGDDYQFTYISYEIPNPNYDKELAAYNNRFETYEKALAEYNIRKQAREEIRRREKEAKLRKELDELTKNQK